MSNSDYMQCMDNVLAGEYIQNIAVFGYVFFFDCPHIPLKVDLGKKGLHTVCLNLKQTCELRIIKSCWVDYNSDKRKNIRQTS